MGCRYTGANNSMQGVWFQVYVKWVKLLGMKELRILFRACYPGSIPTILLDVNSVVIGVYEYNCINHQRILIDDICYTEY